MNYFSLDDNTHTIGAVGAPTGPPMGATVAGAAAPPIARSGNEIPVDHRSRLLMCNSVPMQSDAASGTLLVHVKCDNNDVVVIHYD